MPTPNISRMTPSLGELVAMAVSATKPGRERPDDDAGREVADDRRQPQPGGEEAADEGGHRPTAMVAISPGSWSMALPVRRLVGRRTGAGPCQNDDL